MAKEAINMPSLSRPSLRRVTVSAELSFSARSIAALSSGSSEQVNVVTPVAFFTKVDSMPVTSMDTRRGALRTYIIAGKPVLSSAAIAKQAK